MLPTNYASSLSGFGNLLYGPAKVADSINAFGNLLNYGRESASDYLSKLMTEISQLNDPSENEVKGNNFATGKEYKGALTKAHYAKNGTAGKTTTISPVTGQVVPIIKQEQQQANITNQQPQSALTQEQALQMQQNNALLDSLNNESKINTLLASGAMKGSIDQANMNRWTDIQNYNAQGQAMADVRKAMNSKSAGFTPVEYQPIQIPQEFIQAQQIQNQLKTNPIHNITSYGMSIPNNTSNVSTITAPLGGTVNGKPVTNSMQIKGMFDNDPRRKEIIANAKKIMQSGNNSNIESSSLQYNLPEISTSYTFPTNNVAKPQQIRLATNSMIEQDNKDKKDAEYYRDSLFRVGR